MIPRLALGRCTGVNGPVHGLLGEADRLLRVASQFGQMGETAQHRRGLSDAIKVVVSGLRLVILAEFKIVVTNQSERLRGTWIERIYALSGRKGAGEVVPGKLQISLVLIPVPYLGFNFNAFSTGAATPPIRSTFTNPRAPA